MGTHFNVRTGYDQGQINTAPGFDQGLIRSTYLINLGDIGRDNAGLFMSACNTGQCLS